MNPLTYSHIYIMLSITWLLVLVNVMMCGIMSCDYINTGLHYMYMYDTYWLTSLQHGTQAEEINMGG